MSESKPTSHLGSVFDWDRLRYNYYAVPGHNSIGGWQPLTGLGIRKGGVMDQGVGVDIEDVLPVLPHGSRFAGTGDNAVGRVYVKEKPRSSPLAATPQTESMLPVPKVPTRAEMVERVTGIRWSSFILGFGIARLLSRWKYAALVGGGYAAWRYYEQQKQGAQRGSTPQ